MRANGAVCLFFSVVAAGLAGCAAGPSARAEPLTESDRALLQRAESLLRKGDPAWWSAWEELSTRPVPRVLFVRGLIAWLIQDYKLVAASPEAFGLHLETHPRAEPWRLILGGLARMGAPSAEQAWMVVREGRAPFARTMGAEILGRLGPAALPVLLAGLDSDVLNEAVAAARGLGKQRGSAEACRALSRAASSHADYRVRGEALEALGVYGGPEAQAELVRALRRETDPFALGKAVEGLGRLEEEATAPALIGFMEERLALGDAQGVQAAARALSRITGRNFGSRPERWRLWWAERARSGSER